MPRYEYRVLNPTPAAEKTFLAWIDQLDREFINRDPEHRSKVVRNALHELYLGRPYMTPDPSTPLAEQALLHSFDPRNATLEPETYGDLDVTKYNERKPLIWFWMMYDRSPVGLNHWLGHRMRAMLARHVFKHCGQIVFAPGTDEGRLMEAALDAGAEDIVNHDDGSIEVVTAPHDLVAVKSALGKAGFKPEFAEVTMKPMSEVVVNGDDAARMQKLLDALEALDDVQNVYTTAVVEEA